MCAQPFPYYRVARSPFPQCPLPSDVDSINDFMSARYAASQCAHAAEIRAQSTNDPQWLQYAQWFRCFGNEDRASAAYLPRRTRSPSSYAAPGGKAFLDYEGGAKILLQSNADTPQWLAARQAFREQVTRFHLGLPAMQQNPSQPTIQCVRQPHTQCVTCKYTATQ